MAVTWQSPGALRPLVLPKGGALERLDRLGAGKGVQACTSRTKLGSALP